MILRELRRLAESQGLLREPHFQPKAVKYLIRLDETGRCLGIEATTEPSPPGKRGRPRPKSFPVPRRVVRAAADRADFLVDKAEYVFGVGDFPEDKLKNRRSLFKALVDAVAEETGDAGAVGVSRFLAGLESNGKPFALPADHADGDLFGFVLNTDEELLVSSRGPVAGWWASRRGSYTGSGAQRCLSCGEFSEPVENNPKVVGVPGGNPAGVALVSFNALAFESYGLSRGQNAPICQACADGYTTGLNRLLHPAYPGPSGPMSKQSYRVSDDTTAVFWTRDAELDDVFAFLLDGSPDAVAALLGSPWRGRPSPLDSESPFFLALLSGAQGRAILRDWIESTVRLIAGNLRRYFSEAAIVPRSPADSETVPLRNVLRSLSVRGDDKNLPPNLAGRIFESILLGRPYPGSLLETAVRRMRAEGDAPQARMGLVKAILIRNHGMEVEREMDPSNTNTGYRLGRLFAVLERLQGAAIGNPNATIVDRYFGAASKTPVLVFPRLMSLAQHHASKADSGGYFQKLIEEIVEPLEPETAFPSVLDLPTQGMFALGYYHQRAALWRKKESAPNETAE